jgi:hypothetical protein
LTQQIDDFRVRPDYSPLSHDLTEHGGMILQPASPEHGDIAANFSNDIRKFCKSSNPANKTATSAAQHMSQVGILKEIHTEGTQSGGNRGLSQTADTGSAQN